MLCNVTIHSNSHQSNINSIFTSFFVVFLLKITLNENSSLFPAYSNVLSLSELATVTKKGGA